MKKRESLLNQVGFSRNVQQQPSKLLIRKDTVGYKYYYMALHAIYAIYNSSTDNGCSNFGAALQQAKCSNTEAMQSRQHIAALCGDPVPKSKNCKVVTTDNPELIVPLIRL